MKKGAARRPFRFASAGLFLLFGGGGFFALFDRRQHLAAFDRGELLLDARLLAREAAQVIELGAVHLALALHLDGGDGGRVGLERALHALAARDLADDEGGVEAAVALGD